MDYPARLYAPLARLYSGGAIPACQRWGVAQLPAEGRVLFAGPGPGHDVCAAVDAGLQVTAIDRSPAMVARLRRRLGAREARADLRHGDILQQPAEPLFDAVVAQFFLNVFATPRLPEVLRALRTWLRPGGCLIVGDFAPLPRAGGRWQQAWHDLPMHLFARLGTNALHPVHDPATHLPEAGLALRHRRRFRLFGAGPAWIEGLVAQRVT
jgi:SAM-dependent methyltransferase